MSDEYSQPTLELSRTFEGWWLPRRPLCCDDDYAALRRRSRADALRCKHIEANPSALVNTIMEHHGQRLRLHVRHPHRQGRT